MLCLCIWSHIHDALTPLLMESWTKSSKFFNFPSNQHLESWNLEALEQWAQMHIWAGFWMDENLTSTLLNDFRSMLKSQACVRKPTKRSDKIFSQNDARSFPDGYKKYVAEERLTKQHLNISRSVCKHVSLNRILINSNLF